MANEISNTSPTNAQTPASAPPTEPLAYRRGRLGDDRQQELRAREAVAALAAIFESANTTEDISQKRQAHLEIGRNALAEMSALNMRNTEEPDTPGENKQAEARHFHNQIRTHIENFRHRNPDIYASQDPQIIYLAESQLIHTLYERLSEHFPDAALGARCSEFAQCGFDILVNSEPDAPIELFRLQREPVLVGENLLRPDHVFVVIGRDSETDPEDHSTWNSDAVVFDASQERIYPKQEMADQFNQIQQDTLGSTLTEVIARVEPSEAAEVSRERGRP